MTADKRDEELIENILNRVVAHTNKDGTQLTRLQAQAIINAGWIPRERAIDHCEVCIICVANQFKEVKEPCPQCFGRGVILKDSK